MQTLEQERAKFVLEKIREIKGEGNKYKTIAKKLPSLIATNGLLPTLAFLKSKSEYKEMYQNLTKWLEKRFQRHNKHNDIFKTLLDCDSVFLLVVTREALAVAEWFKRLVESEEE